MNTARYVAVLVSIKEQQQTTVHVAESRAQALEWLRQQIPPDHWKDSTYLNQGVVTRAGLSPDNPLVGSAERVVGMHWPLHTYDAETRTERWSFTRLEFAMIFEREIG